MKIAIHHKKGGFSERWIRYCNDNNIEYKIVNCYDSDIIEQVKDCDGLMWHHSHGNYKDVLFAKQLLYSLEVSGKKVFPDFNTCWHFDDKIGQKYLLESINAPLVPSHVFYTKKEALQWIEQTTFPKVFKLRSGAGSANVKLVKTKKSIQKYVGKMFNKGFCQYNKIGYVWGMIKKYRAGNETLIRVCKSFKTLFISSEFNKMHGREKGYAYFQDFIPGNAFDIRVVVVGDKAFGLKRLVRKNDFRASGSGSIVYGKEEIDERCVRIAFAVNEKIKSQSIAYDFVFNENNEPLMIEISYGYFAAAYDRCQGYWDRDMTWHAGENFDFCGWMVENLVAEIKKQAPESGLQECESFTGEK
jgi:glutathione synthase/RimK-type ligase-like ATP-grasp enzyme